MDILNADVGALQEDVGGESQQAKLEGGIERAKRKAHVEKPIHDRSNGFKESFLPELAFGFDDVVDE